MRSYARVMGKQPGDSGVPGKRRADAERSIEAILDAAMQCLLADGHVSIAAIARAAGVSRVTVYAHFPTREAVLEAALGRALGDVTGILGEAALDRGSATEALARLLRSSWPILARYRNLYAAASTTLAPAQLRDHHEPVLGRIETLVMRGQRAGEFRTDLPVSWLVGAIYTLVHLAAEELNAGRLRDDEAGKVLTETALSLVTAPGRSGPREDDDLVGRLQA